MDSTSPRRRYCHRLADPAARVDQENLGRIRGLDQNKNRDLKDEAMKAKRFYLYLFIILGHGMMAAGLAAAMAPTMFGTYNDAFMERRQAKKWKKMCEGSARYDAMSEAYVLRKPNPCDPTAKEWKP